MTEEIFDYTNPDSLRMDALREIANIGAGNSATALSQLIKTGIDIAVPKANVIPVNQVGMVLKKHGSVVVILFKVYGGAPGTMMLVLPKIGALTIADLVQGLSVGTTTELCGMSESAVREVGNIVTGSYLNALSGFTHLPMVPSIPYMAKGDIVEVMDELTNKFALEDSQAFILETDFFTSGQLSITGHFLYIPAQGALAQIFAALSI